VVLRSRDASALRTASASVAAMIERVKKNLAA
jgi:hypothetical protein